MGGDARQRRQFVLDATQGMSAEAVVDLLEAASTAERHSVSHSMIRVLTKMAQHAGTGSDENRIVADRSLREAVGRLVNQWSLEDANPEAYSKALEHMSTRPTGPALHNDATSADAACEPERIVEMALEIGAEGGTLWRAVDRLTQGEGVARLLDLLEGAPNRPTAQAVLRRLSDQSMLRRLLTSERIDLGVIERLVRLIGTDAVPLLLETADETSETKVRERLYELVAEFGAAAVSATARRLVDASKGGGRPAAQRDLLALLGRILAPDALLPAEVDLRRFLRHADAHVRREAVKLLLRGPKRDEALLAGLGDADGRIVYLALTAAHERCSREGITLIRGRVERCELDAPLRALGIRAVATVRTPDTLRWLIGRAVTRSKLFRQLRLLPAEPETLAALAAIGSGWRNDPEAAPVIELAMRSKSPEIRNALKGQVAAAAARAS